MNIYEARWQNAKKQAERINQMFNKGYIAIYDNDIITQPFVITDKEIRLPLGGRCSVRFFANDPDWDDGLHDTVNETNELFGQFKFYQEVPAP